MGLEVSEAQFERLVQDALDAMPANLMAQMDNVLFVIEDRGDPPDVLGLYDGIPVTERGDYGGMVMPDTIYLYRLALCDFVDTEQELVNEVRVTVVHEIAHHFGIEDDRLHELGWD